MNKKLKNNIAPKITISTGPPTNFKNYFLQEYNKKFKLTKTNAEIVGKWNYYTGQQKPNNPDKWSIDNHILRMKKP